MSEHCERRGGWVCNTKILKRDMDILRRGMDPKNHTSSEGHRRPRRRCLSWSEPNFYKFCIYLFYFFTVKNFPMSYC